MMHPDQVKSFGDVTLPQLQSWNYASCSRHEKPAPDCEFRECGGELFRHQRIGVAWLYVAKRGLLADQTGLGKTNIIVALASLLAEREELTRGVVVCQAPAMLQWVREFGRWAPGLRVEGVTGDIGPSLRRIRYARDWQVIVVGYQTMLRDIDILVQLGFNLVVADDVDPLRKHSNKTALAFDRLARGSERVVVMNATPLQMNLLEVHAQTVPIGGRDVFGTKSAFENRYIRKEPTYLWIPGRGGRRRIKQWEVVGYKNFDEFRRLLSPMVLRRRYEDVEDDVAIPAVAPVERVLLDLHSQQREKYEELRRGVLQLITKDGPKVKRAVAMAKFVFGEQICSGLAALEVEDGPGTSAKLDWLEGRLMGDWQDEKVVVFLKYRGTADALVKRMRKQGVKAELLWGLDRDAQRRQAAIDRFWQDPATRVFVGTPALERSLNLQVARVLVWADSLLNPARMIQLLGRIRRVGSGHRRVYPVHLLSTDTQEEGYEAVLRSRQALADATWDEEGGEVFEKLSGLELLRLIRP